MAAILDFTKKMAAAQTVPVERFLNAVMHLVTQLNENGVIVYLVAWLFHWIFIYAFSTCQRVLLDDKASLKYKLNVGY